MNKLKRQIKQCEANIFLNEVMARYQTQLLEKKLKLKSSKLIWMTLVTGVLGGFLFARKKSLPQMVRASVLAYFAFRRVQNSAQLIGKLIKKKPPSNYP